VYSVPVGELRGAIADSGRDRGVLAGWLVPCSKPAQAPVRRRWCCGLPLYVIYRKTERSRCFAASRSPSGRCAKALGLEFGSILVLILGTELDDDIVQTAGRLAATRDGPGGRRGRGDLGVRMPLAYRAPLSDAQIRRAREGWRGPSWWGGVRGRRGRHRDRPSPPAGQAIVNEARRRG
jgi:APA family basic amino acid/polyamine antiporter